jgi:hypothetical protein
MVSLIVIATVVLVIAAMASNPILAASIGQIFGTAWSDTIAFLMRVVSR